MQKMARCSQARCELSIYIMGIMWFKYGKKKKKFFKLIKTGSLFFTKKKKNPKDKHSSENRLWEPEEEPARKDVTQIPLSSGGGGEENGTQETKNIPFKSDISLGV